MNQEHQSSSEQPTPRHRSERAADETTDHAPRDTTADAYVDEVVAGAPTPEVGRTIAAIYARYGTAFALYLALDGVDKYVRDYGPGHEPADATSEHGIEADFKNAYYASFPDRKALVDDTIASFDWSATLRRLLRDHLDLEQMVVFDRDAIWRFVNDHYEIIEGQDGLHVFERWP